MKAVEVAAGLVFRDGQLLISQRRAGDHLGGLWEFPGGKRHVGESFEECLARELMEELAIVVEVGRCLETVSHDYPEKRVEIRFFKCRLVSGEPKAVGCANFRWVASSELGDYLFPPADKPLIGLLQKNPVLWGD